jgi:hypothetical protein
MLILRHIYLDSATLLGYVFVILQNSARNPAIIRRKLDAPRPLA